MPLLEIEDLTVEFATGHGSFRAVDGVSLSVEAGDVLAIVGESGSGKSVAMLAVMGLLPWSAQVTAARLAFDGVDLLGLSPRQRRRIVGKDMAMIFQEPMSSLNPVLHRRLPDRRGAEGASRHRAARSGAGGRCISSPPSASPTPSAASAPFRTSSPAA